MIKALLTIGHQLGLRATGHGVISLLKCPSRTYSHKQGPTTPSFQRQIKTDCAVKNDFNFRILQHDDNVTNISGSNVQLDDLELCLAGQKLIVNLTWLRDSCHCTKCTHQYSRQRLFTPKDFKKYMFNISDIQVEGFDGKSNEMYLNVEWADGHKSCYSFDWLCYVNGLYKETQLRLGAQQTSKFLFPKDDFYFPTHENCILPDYWTVSKINSNLRPVDYQDLVDGFKFHDEPTYINANRINEMTSRRRDAMLTLSEQLIVYGLAKIVNVPQERDQVLKVARSLAYERPTGYGTVFNVVVEQSEEINLAYSSQEFDLHSDLTYREISPGVQLLHCIRNSAQGGFSYFSDAFNAAKILRETYPKLFEVLLQFPATFVVRDPYRDLKFRRQQPILTLNYQGDLSDVYYSPFMLPPIGHREDIKLFYLAQCKLTEILQSKENKLVVKMDPGDLFIFHNRRVLHGRSSYDPTTSDRFLQGCYMDWDEVQCLHEKLRSNNKHT